MADWTIVAGDTAPGFQDTLRYADGSEVNLTGCTVAFQMRSLTASSAMRLTGQTVITDPRGGVLFKPSAQDTVAGRYMGKWQVTSPVWGQMTFPTDGYLWINVEPNLVDDGPQQIIGLPDVKDALGIPASDREQDEKLLRAISSIRPVIEGLVGPIVVQRFEEWHTGGMPYILLRRRPSSTFGTQPVLNVLACSEYQGPIEWPLAIVGSPAQGQTYSCQVDTRLAQVVRRTAGGGIQPFPGPAAQSVHVIYEAGQAQVPDNVYDAALELLRIHYETSMGVGTGRQTVGDAQNDIGQRILGFFVPNSVKERLGVTKKAPAVG